MPHKHLYMLTFKNYIVMKTSLLASALLLSSSLVFGKCGTTSNQDKPATEDQQQAQERPSTSDNTRVQVALLLDTSNSMDGLIDQAKSRLWNIINTLTTLKYKGKAPVVEIALYEYGNDGLSSASDFIRQVTPLTTDLDLISEKLFSLKTNGGSEYCGAVIQKAVNQLEWGNNNADMKLVYIAGNESFNQGSISYKEVIPDALQRNIYINTIHCGSYEGGISDSWKDGASRGKGKYFSLDSDKKVRFVETPYDARIEECNQRINKTYISYGHAGTAKKQSQMEQDENAAKMSKANYVERSVSKSKAAYKNDSWDLVDKVKDDKKALESIKEEELPGELKGKSKAQIAAVVSEKTKERENIQKEIEQLARKRQVFIDEQNKKHKTEDDLGEAINSSILTLAKEMGYVVVK